MDTFKERERELLTLSDSHRQDDLAFTYYGEAIELCPYFCKAFLNRALLHYHRGSIEEALSDCEKAAEINPEFYEVYSFRGSYVDSFLI
jgi:tetratricopeptide (TPR) repeat protein